MSSTKNNINICIENAWTATDKISTICKSDLSDKIKGEFFQAVAVSVLKYGYTN